MKKGSNLSFMFVSDEDFIRDFTNASSLSHALQLYGYSHVGGYARVYKRRCESLGLDYKQKGRDGRKFGASGVRRTSAYPHDEMFSKASEASRSSVKRIIKRDNLLEYRCAICDMFPEWCGTKLTLILDHINGVGDDNRLENLRWLCPNCNSQTTTFSGRNSKYKN